MSYAKTGYETLSQLEIQIDAHNEWLNDNEESYQAKLDFTVASETSMELSEYLNEMKVRYWYRLP